MTNLYCCVILGYKVEREVQDIMYMLFQNVKSGVTIVTSGEHGMDCRLKLDILADKVARDSLDIHYVSDDWQSMFSDDTLLAVYEYNLSIGCINFVKRMEPVRLLPDIINMFECECMYEELSYKDSEVKAQIMVDAIISGKVPFGNYSIMYDVDREADYSEYNTALLDVHNKLFNIK